MIKNIIITDFLQKAELNKWQTSAQSKIKRVLFYTGTSRSFRSSFIGYLYEISKIFPVILLSEKLDLQTENILKDKKLFPKIEKIISVNQYGSSWKNLFSKNFYLYKTAKKAIKSFKPHILVSSSDMHSLFDLYLMRLAKKERVLKIAFQVGNVADSALTSRWVDRINANLRFPLFLPLFLRLFFVQCRKYAGHLFYYWLLPLTVWEKPFFGKSSYILRRGQSGMRDSDYQIVFSKRDYRLHLKDGVPAEKLYILSHPLARDNSREIFTKLSSGGFNKNKKRKKIITLTLSAEVEFGILTKSLSPISRGEKEREWIEIVELIGKILNDWEIYIKPHPDAKNVSVFKDGLLKICKDVKFIDQEDTIDKCIDVADVIIGLPLASSQALLTASLKYPQKPVIALDFKHELLGDYYKDFPGVEYIDNEKKFIRILESIRGNKYLKQKVNPEKEGFSNMKSLFDYLLSIRRRI